MAYTIVDLTSGDRFAHLETSTLPTASTIKLALVYELFKQVEEGRIRLEDTLVLDRAKAVGGTGVLADLGTPTLSIRDYAVLMVRLSDNTATNVLIDRLGMEKIAQRLQALGLTATKLRRHMMDTAAARRGDENVSTPAEIARLLQTLQKMPDAIALLKMSKENRLRRGLPPDVEAADKSGELDGVRVDAGIVFAKNRPVCVLGDDGVSEGRDRRGACDRGPFARRLRVLQSPRRRRPGTPAALDPINPQTSSQILSV